MTRRSRATTDPAPTSKVAAKPPALPHSLDPLDDIARHVDGAFVVVLKVTGGKYRRRCFLSVAAAQNAAQKATDRGEAATVMLCQLKPLWKVKGGTA